MSNKCVNLYTCITIKNLKFLWFGSTNFCIVESDTNYWKIIFKNWTISTIDWLYKLLAVLVEPILCYLMKVNDVFGVFQEENYSVWKYLDKWTLYSTNEWR